MQHGRITDIKVSGRRDQQIRFAQKAKINIFNFAGIVPIIMDGSFSNQVLAQICLYERKFADNPGAELTLEVLPKELDEEVAAHMVRGFGGVMTKLTKTQADYIKVAVDGPFKVDSYKY